MSQGGNYPHVPDIRKMENYCYIDQGHPNLSQQNSNSQNGHGITQTKTYIGYESFQGIEQMYGGYEWLNKQGNREYSVDPTVNDHQVPEQLNTQENGEYYPDLTVNSYRVPEKQSVPMSSNPHPGGQCSNGITNFHDPVLTAVGKRMEFELSDYIHITSILPQNILHNQELLNRCIDNCNYLGQLPFEVCRKTPQNAVDAQFQAGNSAQNNNIQQNHLPKKGRGRPKKHFLEQAPVPSEGSPQRVSVDPHVYSRHRQAINQQNSQEKKKTGIAMLESLVKRKRNRFHDSIEEVEELLYLLKDHPWHEFICAPCYCRHLYQKIEWHINNMKIVKVDELWTKENTLDKWNGIPNPTNSAINSKTSRERDRRYKECMENESNHLSYLHNVLNDLKTVLKSCLEAFGFNLLPNKDLIVESTRKRPALDDPSVPYKVQCPGEKFSSSSEEVTDTQNSAPAPGEVTRVFVEPDGSLMYNQPSEYNDPNTANMNYSGTSYNDYESSSRGDLDIPPPQYLPPQYPRPQYPPPQIPYIDLDITGI